MLEELAALSQIADIDSKALRAETELKEIPERVGGLEADYRGLSSLLDAERQQVAEASELLAAQDLEITNQNQALSKSKSKSAQARNSREVDAVERELEVIRRTIKDRESERDALRAAIRTRRESLEQRETNLSELEVVVAKEKSAGEARLKELQAELESVLSGREELAGKVTGPIMRRYGVIRARRGSGVSSIKAGSCVGCNVALAPQIAIKVQRGESIEQCPSCQRFLFSRSSAPTSED